MAKRTPDVFVLGAGVIGLSCALALLKSGLKVTVYCADSPFQSTSSAAGALWGVHLVGEDERIGPWAAATLDHFRRMMAEPTTGVREVAGLQAFFDDQPEPPEMAGGLPGLAKADQATLPAGYTAGWRYLAPVIAMPVYLGYLVSQVISHGGMVHVDEPLRSLEHTAERTSAPVIVNCTGIGARELVPDDAMVPVRGQVLVVVNPGISEFFVGERSEPERITYFFPHGGTVLLGGTEQPGNADTRPDEAIASAIRSACAAIDPRLAKARVLDHRVGLRPLRPAVRLEAQPLPGGRHVVHNYGHGGSGVTLSWGCAQAVSSLVAELLA
ncbi:MAG TPA: FAD-dependent oxidoreductase [Streptosporangiaceae bacterium]|nr:FAD-dependent oxidoreductase [Streptosporangiaceae bacterium]